MAQTAVHAGITEDEGLVARALTRHVTGEGITKAVEISDYGCEEGASTLAFCRGRCWGS